MSGLPLHVLLSSDADSDNDLFNSEEDTGTEAYESEDDDVTTPGTVDDSGDQSDASTEIEGPGDSEPSQISGANADAATEASGSAVHHTENDEVEIVRVDRQSERNATVEQEELDESDDFQTPRKRRRVKMEDGEEEKPKTSAVPAAHLEDSFDSESCPICFEPWTNSGDHRLASLKCGHLFGYGCIDKWLMGSGRNCPQCNSSSKRKDIRVIYAKKLTMADTAEADRLRQEVAKERNLRLQAEAEAVSYRIQAQFIGDECTRLKQKIEDLQETMNSGGYTIGGNSVLGSSLMKDGASSATGGSYVLQKLLGIQEGACRVMAPCNYMKLLCIAQTSPNPLFRGFGIRKVHLVDHHMDRFLVLHSQMIRDLALHPDMTDGLLLSVSMDKTAKLVSLFTSQVVQTYSCQMPVWSCTWHRDNHHQFFVGLVNGQVLQFDTRKTNASLKSFTNASVTPVCSLQYAPRDTNADTFRQGGIFVGQLDRLTFFEENLTETAASQEPNSSASTPDGFRPHPLPLDGSLVSLSFEARTRHLLASFRPSRTQPALAQVRHLMCQMESRASDAHVTGEAPSRHCTCNLLHVLTGGRQMQRIMRSKLFRGPGQRLLAASGDEERAGTIVWDAAQGEQLQVLRGANSAVVDVAPFDIAAEAGAEKHGLVTLTESAVQFFRWREAT